VRGGGQGVGVVEGLIARQAGVISRDQALRSGVSDDVLRERVRSGRWQRPYGSVYVTYSGPITRAAWLWGAVLRCGPEAVLSHQTAAELEGLIGPPVSTEPWQKIHVTVPEKRRIVPPPGVQHHYSTRPLEEMRHPVREPPRTRIAETVVDLTQSAHTLDDAIGWIARACGTRLTTADRIAQAMARRRRLRWRTELRIALGDTASGAHSLLETRYLRRVERAHGLPPAKRQVKVRRDGRTEFKDAEYEAYGVVVEIDGEAAHPAERRRFDRRRDNAVIADGSAPLRYDTADLSERPCEVAAQLAQVLRFRGWTGTPKACGPGCAVRAIA
jgi:very-short-patch-repair endonuclease